MHESGKKYHHLKREKHCGPGVLRNDFDVVMMMMMMMMVVVVVVIMRVMMMNEIKMHFTIFFQNVEEC